MLHAGIGPTHVNELLSSINVPSVGESTLKAHEREVGPQIEKLAKESCLESLESERNLWKEESKKENVEVGASYDMEWQKREKAHNSLTGVGSMIALKTGNVICYGSREKRHATCEAASRQSKKPRIHDCRLNWDGSSKAMEADVCADLVKRQGQQYSSGMGFDGDYAAQEIPAPPAASEIEKVSLSKDYHQIIFDLETSGRGNDAEILQIAATDGKDEFSTYVKPCNVISPEASAVNKLTFERGMLFYDGKPIADAIAIDVALKNLIEWLKSRMPCILVGHNCKSFDARFLVQAAEKNGVMDDLAQTVSGFTDSLPAFRELLPERKSHSQESLVKDLLHKSCEAHNALADVQSLYQLVNKFLNVKLLQKHSFKVSWVESCQKRLKERKLLVNTLQPLVRERYMSASMAKKCASSGLGLHHLQLVYQRGKEEGVRQVLMERFDNKPRVSSNKPVLAQICQYFIDNAN